MDRNGINVEIRTFMQVRFRCFLKTSLQHVQREGTWRYVSTGVSWSLIFQKGVVLGVYRSDGKNIELTPAAEAYNKVSNGKLLENIKLWVVSKLFLCKYVFPLVTWRFTLLPTTDLKLLSYIYFFYIYCLSHIFVLFYSLGVLLKEGRFYKHGLIVRLHIVHDVPPVCLNGLKCNNMKIDLKINLAE